MALPDLPGYVRLSPTQLEARGLSPRSRSVLTPGGEVIPRRQYENRRIEVQRTSTPETFGWKSWSEFQSSRKSKIYQYDFELAYKEHGGSTNIDELIAAGATREEALSWASESKGLTRKQMRQIDSQFNQLFTSAMPHWKARKSAAYRNPDGPVAQFLVYLGLRDEDATYDVGETQPT